MTFTFRSRVSLFNFQAVFCFPPVSDTPTINRGRNTSARSKKEEKMGKKIYVAFGRLRVVPNLRDVV